MKKITLSAVALLMAALSFNVAAQDNAEKVRERITPLIDGKLNTIEQDELFSSLVFENDRLVSYKYDVMENHMTQAEFDEAILVMIDAKAAVVIRDGNSRKIGAEIPAGVRIPLPIVSVDYNYQPLSFKNRCEGKPRYICVRLNYYPSF